MSGATIPPLEARPCFVAGVPDETYHGDRTSVSSSTLKVLVSKTPAHARAALDDPRPDTPALLLGRAVHARVLEPETFGTRYAVAPRVDRRTKGGKAAWDEFAAARPGAAILTEDDGATVEAIAAAIQAHPLARAAVQGGAAELSGFLTDHETGVQCRIRPDYTRMDAGVLVDVKTTLDASPGAFQKSVHTLGYHVQAAMYAAGFHAITGEPLRDFVFISVEKARPWAVAVYRIEEEALAVGRWLYRRALRTWADCLERDTWPGYSHRIESISLPPWAFNDVETMTHEDQ